MADDTTFKIIFYAGISLLGSIVLIVIASIAIHDHNEISSWSDCRCYFDNNSTYDPKYGYYSSVKITATAECESDEELFPVVVKWPPAKNWYTRQTPSAIKDYFADLLIIGESECYVDEKSSDPKKAVTENIIGYGWYIFYLILALILILIPVVIIIIASCS